jgi:hypothetical protein
MTAPVSLAGGVPVILDAYADVNIDAYIAAGGTTAHCRDDVIGSLAPLGTVREATVTFRRGAIGLGSIAMQIAFTPTSDVATSSVDARIMYGVNYQAINVNHLATPEGVAIPRQPSALWGAVSLVAIVAATSYVVDSVRPDDGRPLTAAIENTPAAIANTLLAQQASTDPAANGATPIGQAIPNLGLGSSLETLEIVGIAILGVIGLLAAGYFITSIARVRGN